MRNDLTDITLIVDRSGSMRNCQSDAQGGINTFIEEQKKGPGEALFTLVQFDTQYEFVHNGANIKSIGPYTLSPRGWTALNDAVGRAINEVGSRLASLPEDQRPGCVNIVIVTDGQENSSKEFTTRQVRDMITHQREKYNWQFTFIGASETAFEQGKAFAIPASGIVVSDNPGNAYRGVSRSTERLRAQNMAGAALDTSYSAEERKKMA